MRSLAILCVVLTGCTTASMTTPTVAESVQGRASWYGNEHHGRRTASGEIFNQNAMTCAHLSLRFGTIVTVTNLDNGRQATCRINDRGPARWTGKIIDVSRGMANALGMIRSGTANVRLTY